MRFVSVIILFVIYCCVSLPGFSAPVPAINLDPGTDVADPPGPGQFPGSDSGNADSVIGWVFSVEEPVLLTHLGWYDKDGNGLSHEHRIGTWRNLVGDDYEPVTDLVLMGGESEELFGPWRRAALAAPIELNVGWYAIGGLDNSESTDGVIYVKGGLQAMPLPIDSRLGSLVVGALRLDNVFGPPELTLLADGAYLGPMFFIEPVPEPGTLALLAIGAMLLGIRAARRRSVSQT